MVVVFTILFLYMIRNFITSILLAAIFAGFLYPLYNRILKVVKQKRFIASGITVFLTFLLIVLPIIGLFNIVVSEAISLSQQLSPELKAQIKTGEVDNPPLPEWIPFVEFLEPFKDQIFSNLDETTDKIRAFLVRNLGNLSQGTLSVIVNLFVLLYGMYFFFIRGDKTLEIARKYVPLSSEDFQTMLDKGMLVTMATLKGAVFIGILQGALIGLSFWALGLPGAFFWGTISAVVSVVPTFGCGLVWIPAVIYLMLTGEMISAMALLAWGAGVVGVVDNLLRPYLVGKDAHMPDLLILVSTLGGLGLFGATGFIIGPVLAAFLLTVWEIFQFTFEQELS